MTGPIASRAPHMEEHHILHLLGIRLDLPRDMGDRGEFRHAGPDVVGELFGHLCWRLAGGYRYYRYVGGLYKKGEAVS